MITDEETKNEIIRTLTFEKCESCIRNMLIQIRNNAGNSKWSVITFSETIEYYMDCITILRENHKRNEAIVDQMTKYMTY